MSILMADRIFARPDLVVGRDKVFGEPDHFNEHLNYFQDAVVVDGGNVGDYFFGHEKKVWNVHKDIPCAALPFPKMIVEIPFAGGVKAKNWAGIV